MCLSCDWSVHFLMPLDWGTETHAPAVLQDAVFRSQGSSNLKIRHGAHSHGGSRDKLARMKNGFFLCVYSRLHLSKL